MTKQAYIEKRFNKSSMVEIDRANAIIAEYQAQGFTLTLRQLYYQFVARGLIPNKDLEYKRLGTLINHGRLAGLIDWEAIEDRTRNLKTQPSWDSSAEIVRICANQFRVPMWVDQPTIPEVWIEKDALTGVVEPACRDLDIPYFACRGYSSQSEQWAAGQRILHRYQSTGQETLILHFGDHDPSGVDMSRDNTTRLEMFTAAEGITLRRLALNMKQVRQHNPPPNPAKLTDSRCASYIEKYGDQSWELDALDPKIIDKLIRDAVAPLIDDDKWQANKRKQASGRRTLDAVAKNWSVITSRLPGPIHWIAKGMTP